MIYLIISLTSCLKQLNEKYSRCGDFNLLETTIYLVQEKLTTIPKLGTKKLSIRKLVSCYLDRINVMNPHLNAVIDIANINHLNLDFYDNIIRECQYHKSCCIKRIGPLFGIPILVKDNIAVEGMRNTAGSRALFDELPIKSADVINQLKKLGAIIIGKTNLSELSSSRSKYLKAGYSELGGQTRNSYGYNTTTNGSSSGSATATSANLAVVTLGTDTNGSIIFPSFVQNIVSLRVTPGSVSINGLIPVSTFWDTIGPMSRTVEDTETLFYAIKQENKYKLDECTNHNQFFYSKNDDKKTLKDLLFNLKKIFPCIQKMNIQKVPKYVNCLELFGTSIKSGVNYYLEKYTLREKIREIDDIIKFNGLKQQEILTYLVSQNQNQAQKEIECQLKAQNYFEKNKMKFGDVLVLTNNAYSYFHQPITESFYTVLHIPVLSNQFKVYGLNLVTKYQCEKLLFEIAKLIEKFNSPRIEPEFLDFPN